MPFWNVGRLCLTDVSTILAPSNQSEISMINGHDSFGAGTTTKVENVGGFRLVWNYKEGAGAAVTVYQVIAKQEDGLKMALFLRAGTETGELTPDSLLAEPYFTGVFRADGRVMFKGTTVFFGAHGMKRDLACRKHVWERAYDLMDVAPKPSWKDV